MRLPPGCSPAPRPRRFPLGAAGRTPRDQQHVPRDDSLRVPFPAAARRRGPSTSLSHRASSDLKPGEAGPLQPPGAPGSPRLRPPGPPTPSPRAFPGARPGCLHNRSPRRRPRTHLRPRCQPDPKTKGSGESSLQRRRKRRPWDTPFAAPAPGRGGHRNIIPFFLSILPSSHICVSFNILNLYCEGNP